MRSLGRDRRRGFESWGRSSGYVGVACLAGWLSMGCTEEGAKGAILLRDITAQTQIAFRHTDGSCGRRYIVEAMSGGLALFDYDSDGDVDIYFVNGSPLPGTKVEATPQNVLYRNEGGWRFTDVTDEAQVGDRGFGLGVAVGDYDNDGHPDIFVNNFGPNVLYRNNGNGTFADVTTTAGVAGGEKVGAGACFLDMDADGDLDLFVANYLGFTYDNHVTRAVRGIPKYPGPRDYPPVPNTLYRNNGDGTFTDVSVESGLSAHEGTGMGAVGADYDGDGDTDIFVANDMLGNFVFENDGKGKFKEVGLKVGFAYDLHGHEQSSMGVACGDYDNDGLLDFDVTSFQRELPTLYRNRGDRRFDDVTLPSGAGARSYPYVTWGNAFIDFDNDGWRDIFIASGHVDDNVEAFDDSTAYLSPNVLLRNTGDGKFVDISNQAGDGLRVKFSSRGAGFDDLDNDGDIDVVILNSRQPPTILRNDSVTENHWIGVRLRGTTTNRDGVGARVKVVAGDLTQVDEVHSGCGYQSHFGTQLHFGLGQRNGVDRIEVRWIGGGVDVMKDAEVDRVVTIQESLVGRQ